MESPGQKDPHAIGPLLAPEACECHDAAWVDGERTFPGTLDDIAPCRRWMGDAARRAGFMREVIEELQVAVSEALTNIVRHAYRGSGRPGPICVRLRFSEACMSIRFQDWGEVFDFDGWAPPDESAPREGGYGILLMRRFADEISYAHHEDGSNVLIMRRHLASPPVLASPVVRHRREVASEPTGETQSTPAAGSADKRAPRGDAPGDGSGQGARNAVTRSRSEYGQTWLLD